MPALAANAGVQYPASLSVRWNDSLVGTLALDRSGAMHFRYSEEWLQDAGTHPISIALPKQAEAFGDRACKPFFENLLPEHWQREAAAKALEVSSRNPFRLLAALGGDTAGALTFWPADEEFDPEQQIAPAKALAGSELQQLIEDLANTPMLAGRRDARYCLAGAQSKLPVMLVRDEIALAPPGHPTTHVLKPEPDRFPRLAANEAFCLSLAKAVGLDVAEVEWRSAGDRPFVLVERYDRTTEGGRTSRLHQEDFVQALGVLSSKKYASDGGPVFRDCFAMVDRATTDPQTEALKLLDAALFNLVIGNADAHAKNFSMLRLANGNVVLAPLYDLVATILWPELSANFAMKYGRARTLEDMGKGSFERFAADAGVEFDMVQARGLLICERVTHAIEAGVHVLGHEDPASLSALAAIIRDRAERVRLKLMLMQ